MSFFCKRRNITIITNFVLVVIFSFVFAVSMIKDNAVSVYGGEDNSPIYLGNGQNKNVSIMVNVYENTDIVNKMIDIFYDRNIRITFFVGGCWADDNEETLNKMVEKGFEIGNHGYYHRDHKKISCESNRQEIENCGKIIKGLCGYEATLFAPPSGSFGNDTLLVASQSGYKVIMWSKDTIDWRDSDENLIIKRATKKPKNGDLILMHPKAHTLNALPKIIDFYIDNGFNIVTVGENIKGI